MEQIEKNNEEQIVDIRNIIYKCISRWYWFAMSIIITVFIAFIYSKKIEPQYSASAEIQIKSDSKNGSSPGEIDFNNTGFFKSSTNVQNEIVAFASPDLMEEVVDRLNLNIVYRKPGFFYNKLLYGTSLPITISMPDLANNAVASFKIKLLEKEKFIISDLTFNGEKFLNKKLEGRLYDTITSPYGSLIVSPTIHYNKELITETNEILIKRTSKNSAVARYSAKLGVEQNNKDADVITLFVNDVSPQRAEDFLNTLIVVYNEHWIKDKNQIANSTSIFINDRLLVIENELANVDSDISSYKSVNLLPDVDAVANMYLKQNTELNEEIRELSNQIWMAHYIKDYLSKNAITSELLPVNSGIQNANIERLISEHNAKLLERNNLVSNSSEKNVLVKDMDKALMEMRRIIGISVDNQIAVLQNQMSELQRTEKQTSAKLASNPNQAKVLLSVERQQSVKQSLYLYLLQKREENELSQAFTAYNTRIIQKPRTGISPVAPRSAMILLVGFVIGCAIPLGIIILIEYFTTTVRGRQDLKNITLPFLGEIPNCYPKRKGFTRLKKKTATEHRTIVVKSGSRNVINEAFRSLRTNLDFIVKGNDTNAIAITSYNPGSGKSFISINLAIALAIQNKKVLVIDGDLRHASVSQFVENPNRGLSNFLAGQISDIKDVIIKDKNYNLLNILPVGTIPPNPAELLSQDSFKTIIENFKKEYDYVFVDCPPIEIVTDTHIIERSVDRTIFVIRAGLLERSMLSDLEKLYNNATFKNMSCILNGTINERSKYGYKYGYKYGNYYSNNEN